MKPPLSYVPLLPVLLSLAAGVLLFNISATAVLPLLMMAAATALFVLKKEYYGALACAMALGWSTAALHEPEIPPRECCQSGVTYQAVACSGHDTDSGYEIRGEIIAYVGHADSLLYGFRPTPVRLSVPGADLNVTVGDTIYYKGDFIPFKSNPDLPDEFNPATGRNGDCLRFRVSKRDVAIAGNAKGMRWKLQQLRNRLCGYIITSGINADCSNFLAAALLGDGQWITDDDRALYSRTGMAHILALSGAHVAIILMALIIALMPLTVMRLHRTRSLLIILLLWIYAVMTGGSPSVIRAVLMATMLLAGNMLRKPYSGMNALCMAALLILVFTPSALFQAGFQLSFMAVASISLLAQQLNPFHKTMLYRPAGWVAATVAATLGTFAIAMYHFHIFPVYFILFSPVATALLTLVLIGGILLILCGAMDIPHAMLASATDTIFTITHDYLGIADTLPGSTIGNIYISIPAAIALTLLPFALAAWLHYRKRRIAIVSLAALAVTLLLQFLLQPRYPEKELFITDHPYHLAIAAKTGDKLYFFTDADSVQAPLMIKEFEATHKDYMGKRHITGITAIHDTLTTPDIARKGRLLKILGDTYIILNTDKNLYSSPYPTDYLVVAEGFKGDITATVDTFRPRHIIIARNLNTRLRTRYIKELDSTDIEITDLKSNGTLRIKN